MGRGSLLSGWMGERGGRAKLENLIPIDVIRARGLWEFISLFYSLSGSRVTIPDSNVHISKGCGSIQVGPSPPGLHFLAL